MSAIETKCDECRALIPHDEPSVISLNHNPSCSLHPDNVVADRPQPGRKNDKDKDRWDLLPLAPIKAVVKVLTFGAKKYAPNNWQKVQDPQNRYYASTMRHLVAYREGEWLDLCDSHGDNRPFDCKDCSGQPHLANAICGIVFLFFFGPCKQERDPNPELASLFHYVCPVCHARYVTYEAFAKHADRHGHHVVPTREKVP